MIYSILKIFQTIPAFTLTGMLQFKMFYYFQSCHLRMRLLDIQVTSVQFIELCEMLIYHYFPIKESPFSLPKTIWKCKNVWNTKDLYWITNDTIYSLNKT